MGFDAVSMLLTKIEINSLGILEEKTLNTVPILKITWTAGAARTTWPDVIKFFEIAHDHVLKRFQALISPELQATWK